MGSFLVINQFLYISFDSDNAILAIIINNNNLFVIFIFL